MADGSFNEIVGSYLAGSDSATYESELATRSRPDSIGTDLRFQSIKLCDASGMLLQSIKVGQDFYIHFEYLVRRTIPDVLIAVRIETPWGQIIVDSWDRDHLPREVVKESKCLVKVHVAPQHFHPGQYQISLIAAMHLVKWLDKVEPAITFSVEPVSDTGAVEPERRAILKMAYRWEREYF